jgi:hypothetical protein
VCRGLSDLEAGAKSRGGHDECEDHQFGGFLQKDTCGANRSMPDGGAHTRDWISCLSVIPVLGGAVREGRQGVAALSPDCDALILCDGRGISSLYCG